MKEYIVTNYIYDLNGDTIGKRMFTIPQETVNEIRTEVIDEFVRAINSRLLQFVPTDYDDILFIAEQLKGQNK